MLLIRTHHGDDDAWRDVLCHMGELPGLVAPHADPKAHPVPHEPIPRRLIVVDDRTWQGATPDEVREALNADETWTPDLVLLTNDRTTANPRLRPLLAFRGTGGNTFWITSRQAALTYLVLHRPYQWITLEGFEEEAPAGPGGEREKNEAAGDWEKRLPNPVGTCLESLNPPPRYTPPPRALPLLVQENFGLLVRTDYTDDTAWRSLLDTVHRPGPGYDDPIDDFSDYIDVVDDPKFEDSSPEQIMALVAREETAAGLVALADTTAMRDPDHRVLAVPLEDPIGHTFRVYPETVGTMMNNLAIGNTSIEDFMDD
ncbi:DUF6924 domain-containing protein [Streptomyces halstedii]|nr:hypothetical protein [Streptomyces halstedii]